MIKKREWSRETYDSINTGCRIPKAIYKRFEEHMEQTGMSKTQIINAALDAYLPHYNTEGGSEE